MEPGLYDYVDKRNPGRLTVTNFKHIDKKKVLEKSDLSQF